MPALSDNVAPFAFSTQHTEQERCSVCEIYKPLYVVDSKTKQLLADYRTQWKFHVRFGGTHYATICPECTALFDEYSHE